MQVDCQTLDPHSAGASDVPLAARPAVIAVLAGFRCLSSRDTELVPFGVAHHHPPLTVLVDAPDAHLTNLGSKGLGEPPIVPVAAAIANAIRDATGADVRSLPISREEMLRALEEARKRERAREGVPA